MKREEEADEFQSVYFITDWWDGPKSGFAEFNSDIHGFERFFDEERDEWSNLYRIRPVCAKEYLLQAEAHKLFMDWVSDTGSARPHPSLDIENIRYHEVRQLLAGFEHQFYYEKYIGEFIPIAKEETAAGNRISDFNYTVKWKMDGVG